jgi:hypothetical protein
MIPDTEFNAQRLNKIKDPALKEAARAIMLLPNAKDAVDGPSAEENLALVETILSDKRRAIATLRGLLQTPFESELYGSAPLTPALSQARSALGLITQ